MIVLEESLRGERVADCGGLRDTEDRRDTQRITAAGESFLELPVDAQPFQRGRLAAQVEDPGGADRTMVERAVVADQQVRVGGVRPAIAPVIEPAEQDVVGRLVERPSCSGDGEASVAEVDVAVIRRVHGGLHRVLGDLAEAGYDALWHCVRAADIGAAHLRERMFVCAWPCAGAVEYGGGDAADADRTRRFLQRHLGSQQTGRPVAVGPVAVAADAEGFGHRHGRATGGGGFPTAAVAAGAPAAGDLRGERAPDRGVA